MELTTQDTPAAELQAIIEDTSGVGPSPKSATTYWQLLLRD